MAPVGLRPARRLSFLAARTPVGRPVRVALAARGDRRLAARARTPGATVDAAIAPLPLERCTHQAVRPFEDVAKLLVRDAADASPGRHTRLPERLRAPDVADPGDEALIEERVAQGTVRIVRAERGEHPLEVGWLREDVGAEPREAARVQLE